MKVIVDALILFCGIQIFRKNNESRVNWFLGAVLLLNSSLVFLTTPRITCHFFLVICFALSLIRQKRFLLGKIPVKWVWLIYLLVFFIIALSSSSLHGYAVWYKPFRTFVESYFVLFLGFFSCAYVKLNKKIIVVLLVVVLYGFLTIIVRNDPLRMILPVDFNYAYYFGNRLRVASTWSHPIAYGFVCSVFFMCLWDNGRANCVKRILTIFLAISVFVCGSRSAICTLISMICVYTAFKGSKKALKIWFCTIVAACIMAFCVPSVGEKVMLIVDSINGTGQISGSSLGMRQTQLDAALALTANFPFLGGGFDYIQEVLGYGKNVDWKYWMEYGDLYGFESYFYVLIIERGLIGLIAEFVVLSSILIWVFRHRLNDRDAAARAFAVVAGFVVFAFMTGTLDTWIIGMFFLGSYMGKLANFSQQKKMGSV